MSKSIILCLLGAAVLSSAAAQSLDDPTRPYRTPASNGPAGEIRRPFELSGVLLSASRRIAVINGDLYSEGDEIDGARVVRIDPKSVRLQRGNQSIVVPLNGEPPKPLMNRGDPTS